MSLISEALRKARQEAAQRNAEQRGLVLPAGVRYQSLRPRSGPWLAVAGLVGVVAFAAGAVLVWWLWGRAGGEQVAATVPVRQPTAVEEPAVATEPPPAAQGREAVVVAQKPEPVLREPATVVATPVPLPEDPATWPLPPEPAPEAQPTPDERPEPAPAAAGPAGERVFVLEADLGEVTLSLGYIVYRPGSPFAEINGQDVVEGSIVDGVLVEKIEADAVTLRDDQGVVILRASSRR